MHSFGKEMLKEFIREVYSGSVRRLRFSPDFSKYLEALVDSGRGWILATPDLQSANIPMIKFFPTSYYKDGYVNRPVGLRKVLINGTPEIWVANYGRKISRFSLPYFEYLGDVGVWGNPSLTPDGYAYPHSIAVNEALGYVAIAMQPYHRVRIFQIEPWSLVAEIGTGAPGHVYDGKLWNPIDVDWAGDTLLVTCRSGYAEPDQTGPGHITAWDASGNFKGVVLRHRRDGAPSNNEIVSPYRARVFVKDQPTGLFDLYVSLKDRNIVGKFTLDINTLSVSYEETYSKPTGVNVSAPLPTGIEIGPDNTLYVACDGPKVVAGIDLATHILKFFKGFPQWDDKANAAENPGALWGIWDVLYVNNLFGVEGILVADYGNNRIAFLPIQDTVDIPVLFDAELPVGAIVLQDYLPKGFDLNNRIWRVPYRDLEKVKPFIIPYEVPDPPVPNS